MLGLLSGLGSEILEKRHEKKLMEKKLFEDWQQKYTEQQLKANELLPEEKTYISSLPKNRRLMELAHEKLKTAENALPNPMFSRLPLGDKLRSATDFFKDKNKISDRNEFARFLEGEFLPTVMQIEGLPMTEYSVKSFKDKFDVNKLKAKDWKKFFEETSSKLESRAVDIQGKIGKLNEIQLGKLMQDPQIQATMKEEVTRKPDNQVENLSNDKLDALIKLAGNAEIVDEPPEIKKNFLRELGLQIMFDVPLIYAGAAIAAPLGPVGMFIGGGIVALVAAFAGTATERMIIGDPDALSNAYTETKEDTVLTLASHGVGTAAARGIKAVRSLAKQGRELVRNLVSRSFDTAVKDVPDIAVKDVGEFLSSTAKKTNNPFQRIVTKDLANKFSSKEGSYTAKDFADMLSRMRESSHKLAEKYGIPENQIRDIVSKIEERFLPLRANVSKTMGLLSGASDALEKGNVRKVTEIFSELPEKIAIDDGVFTKDQVIRGFLLENANAIRNRYIAPVASVKLTEFINKVETFGHLSSGAVRWALAEIGLNGFTDGQIAKLFAKYSFGSAKDPVTKELMSALQGKIIEEQSGFIWETLKKMAMSSSRVGLRGRVKWEEVDD